MDIATVSTAIGSLKTAFEVARIAIEARDESKIAEAKQALNDRIMDVQNAALLLQEKQSASRDEIDGLKDQVRALLGRIAELEASLDDRLNFELVDIGNGLRAYQRKASALPGTEGAPACTGDPQYFCQPCFDSKALKVALQPAFYSSERIGYSCRVCSEKFLTGSIADVNRRRHQPQGDSGPYGPNHWMG